ncbi:MAG: COX15/CtaA family protein [Chloroflexi bacterium]|nr:COX15/CtaA family protein [Chloroflexota bacterium]MDA1174766.1 COX15/CtaA family protein [Chloroflexota bacterium]
MAMTSWRAEPTTRKAGWLALTAAVLTIGLITYGAWVRASGSGLGCPDWPLCEGSLVPTLEGDTAIEFGHRVFAGITMLMVAVSAWFAWSGRATDALLAKILVGALGLIFVQAVLGGITVLTELNGDVRLAHLTIALATLTLLTAGAIRGLDVQGSPYPGVRIASVFAVWTGIVVLLGGSIVGSNLSAACPGLPLCDDRSPLDAAWMHGIHRTAATLLLFALIGLGFWLRKHRGTMFSIALNHTAVLLIVLQIGIGVSAISQSLPMYLRIMHLGMASLIWWAVATQWLLALKGRSSR